jgi:arylsulfatase A-like enzyme/tetratricopeptide (TPR) repeat protein
VLHQRVCRIESVNNTFANTDPKLGESVDMWKVIMAEQSRIRQVFSRWYLTSLGLVVLAVAGTAWFLTRSGVSQEEIRNVILISIDTCRADHLSCYGYSSKTTPNIDAISEEGVVFENVITPVPITLPAHSSMLTGTTPPYHKVRDNGNYKLGSSNATLAEILRENGYVTGAVVGAFVMDSQFGLDQGFDTYDDRFIEGRKPTIFAFNERRAEEVTRRANSWLEKHQHEKFFLFLHYFDPHHPYGPPEPFASTFSDNLYAGEIAYSDKCIGQVVKRLKKLDLYDSTFLIITSDHGEGRREHSEKTHGYFIYQSTIHVPLVMRVPGGPEGKKVNDIAGLVDIVPSVCSVLRIAMPSWVQGRDLSGYFNRTEPYDEPKDRFMYCESLMPTKYSAAPLIGLVSDRWKYIHAPRPELYDMANDRQEATNLSGQQEQHVRIMREHLRRVLQESSREVADSEFAPDAETRSRLQSLGYVSHTTANESSLLESDRPDPKDLIKFRIPFDEVSLLVSQKKYGQAKMVCSDLLNRWPEVAATHLILSTIAKLENDSKARIRHLSQYLAILEKSDANSSGLLRARPDYGGAYADLGLVFFAEGQVEQAIAHYEKAISFNPHMPRPYRLLGSAYLKLNRLDKAIAYCKMALEIDPDFPEAHGDIGYALSKVGKLDEAIQHYNRALELRPDKDTVVLIHDSLAKLLVQQKKFDEAIVHWSEGLRLNPDQPNMLNDMGIVLSLQGRVDEAVERWNKSLRLKPNQANVHKWLGDALAGHGEIGAALKHWAESLRISPMQPDVHKRLGEVCYRQGKLGEVVKHLTEALKLRSDWPDVINTLAWVKAAYKNEDSYDPAGAVELAQRACKLTEYKLPSILDTLAVAYAASGRFSEAVETAEKAISLAEAANQPRLAQEIRTRLELFQGSQPYYERTNLQKEHNP